MPLGPSGPRGIEADTICGSDDSQWAKCYQTSQPTAYNKSKAVASLLIGGSSACTGWLVGSEGHVMTNEHCIGSASAAQSVNFEFMGEGASCSTSCATWGACPGTVVATTSTLTKVNASLDYALVKLPTNPTSTYGYLQMRSTGAVLNERIYIPQHPAHWGKKIAMTSGGANAKIDSLSAAACSGGTSDLGYAADTQGGSSGSPVLGYSDNTVIGLHHCGACPNRAVPIQSVITNLGTLKPANSVAGGTPPACTTYTGTLSGTGAVQYQPGGTYYQSSVSGAHTANMTGPAGADFDLYLQSGTVRRGRTSPAPRDRPPPKRLRITGPSVITGGRCSRIAAAAATASAPRNHNAFFGRRRPPSPPQRGIGAIQTLRAASRPPDWFYCVKQLVDAGQTAG